MRGFFAVSGLSSQYNHIDIVCSREFYLRFGVLKKLVSLEGFDQSHESPSNDNDLSLVHKCNSLLDGLVKSDLLSIDDLPPRPVGSKSQLYECGKTRIYFSLGVLDLLEVCLILRRS